MFLGYLVMAFPIIAIISFFICFPIFLYDKFHKHIRHIIRYIAIYSFTGCCLSLLYLTILWYFPDITFHPKYHFLNLTPFVWVSEVYAMGMLKMIEQLVLNSVMFIPYGLLLPIVFKKPRNFFIHIFTVFLTTFSIETLQYFMGRSADIDDVIMNCLGGLLGYLVYKIINHFFSKNKYWNYIINKL